MRESFVGEWKFGSAMKTPVLSIEISTCTYRLITDRATANRNAEGPQSHPREESADNGKGDEGVMGKEEMQKYEKRDKSGDGRKQCVTPDVGSVP
jgi:hypothetical protein